MDRAAKKAEALESEQEALDGQLAVARSRIEKGPMELERLLGQRQVHLERRARLLENRACLKTAKIVKWRSWATLQAELATNSAEIKALDGRAKDLRREIADAKIQEKVLGQRLQQIRRDLDLFDHVIHAAHRFGAPRD